MPLFSQNDVRLYYEEHGSGFPVLLFAPGGMRSAASFWAGSPWNPVEALALHFRVIAMDQRNAGQSSAPVTEGDGWQTYTRDHLALLDHLGVERCHVLGGCIGGSYVLGIMQAAPQRIASGVLQQPIGHVPENRQLFFDMFEGWAAGLRAQRPNVKDEVWTAFRERMYAGDFVFSVNREFVRNCNIPMLVLMGDDLYHPQPTSREIVELAPHATLIERWKEGKALRAAVQSVVAFLQQHTPAQ